MGREGSVRSATSLLGGAEDGGVHGSCERVLLCRLEAAPEPEPLLGCAAVLLRDGKARVTGWTGWRVGDELLSLGRLLLLSNEGEGEWKGGR